MKKTITLIVILLAIMASSMAQTQMTSTHLKFKNGISTDSIGSYTGDSLIIDGEGKLKLRDDIAGEYSLSELAAGGGDVTKVGTPVDDQIGVWTGDGTLEGDVNLTYESSIGSLYIGNDGAVPFTAIRSFGTDSDFDQYSDTENRILSVLYSNTATNSNKILRRRYGGVYGAFTAAPTNAVVSENQYHVYDGSGMTTAGTYSFQVDGAIATDDYDTKYTWQLKEGASASGLMLTLGVNGLEYNADHSTDQAANDRWIPDKGYVDGVATSFTFENGITEAAGNVVLGGALTADVDFTATSTYDFTIGSAISPVPLMTVHSDEQVQLRSVSGTNFGYLTIQPNNFSLTRDVAAGQRSFSMGPAGMFITDTEDTKGLEYAADYSTNFTDRSLVDSAHVAAMIASDIADLLGSAVEGVALADSSGVVAGSYFTGWDAATLQSEVDAKADLITQENQTGTTYTFVIGDAGKLVTLSNASAITLTIPTNASVAFPTNTVITFTQLGAGLVTVDDASVTMNSYGGADALLGQYAVATLIKTDTDTWLLSGAIE